MRSNDIIREGTLPDEADIQPKAKFVKGVGGVAKALSFTNKSEVQGAKFQNYVMRPATSHINIASQRLEGEATTAPSNDSPVTLTLQEVEKHTRNLNFIIDALLNEKNVKFIIKDNSILVSYQNKKFNLSDLLAKADLTDIKLNTNQLNLYADLYIGNPNTQKSLNNRIDQYNNKYPGNINAEQYKKMHVAKKYVSSEYSKDLAMKVNRLFRNQTEELSKPNVNIGDLLLHSAVLITTINEHSQPVNFVMRADYSMKPELAEKKQGTYTEKSFFSAAMAESHYITAAKLKERSSREGVRQINSLTLLSGVQGFDLRPLSVYQSDKTESEILLLPGMTFERKAVSKDDGVHILIGEPVERAYAPGPSLQDRFKKIFTYLFGLLGMKSNTPPESIASSTPFEPTQPLPTAKTLHNQKSIKAKQSPHNPLLRAEKLINHFADLSNKLGRAGDKYVKKLGELREGIGKIKQDGTNKSAKEISKELTPIVREVQSQGRAMKEEIKKRSMNTLKVQSLAAPRRRL